MKIALIPIDNRPVCYTLIEQITKIDENLELLLPERNLLGSLTSYANIDGILSWLESLKKVDAIIVSLDTIAYGGLISSRRCQDSFEEIKTRLEKFKTKFKGKVYAFSSIMRISNNDINEEEKEYWNKYGKKIFEYSYNFHMNGTETDEVPTDILNDYLATRQRNFKINKMYLEWLEDGIFDTLVFSKDDCAEFGLNVLESEILQKIIKEKNNKNGHKKTLSAFIKTGADEIPLTLLARAICNFNQKTPGFSVKFLAPESKDLISNYEDISIEKSVQSQIELAGGIISEKKSDLILIVNNFEEFQGEIVMGVKTRSYGGNFELPNSPFMFADVRFANGADNKFVEKILKKIEKINSSKKENGFKNFYGYSAWNTSANTLGSLICVAIVKLFAENYNDEAFKKVQFVRFLDDWAYQANVRQTLKENVKKEMGKENRPDVRKLKKLMIPYEKKIGKILKVNSEISYKFPWKRFFEIEVIIK